MHRFTITLPDDLYTWLKKRAEEEGRSISNQNAHFLKLFKDTIGDHSAGLLCPPGYSLQDERWTTLKRNSQGKKGEE